MSDSATTQLRTCRSRCRQAKRSLWQGEPEWRALALHAFHARKVAIYFGILAVWRVAFAVADGDAAASAAISTLWLLLLGCAAVGVLTLMAWLTSRDHHLHHHQSTPV